MAESFSEVLESLRASIARISAQELADSPEVVRLDIRETEEFAAGHIPDAVHISRGFLELKVERALPPDREIAVYCGGEARSMLAAETLKRLGYEHVRCLDGGLEAWKERGLPIARPPTLTPQQRARYDRHLRIPEVGEAGQLRLLNSKVLIVGAGGLGSPGAFYLAAAGVGTLAIVDSDVVEESNLQRQILHRVTRLGDPKVESARQTLGEFNPGIKVVTIERRIDSTNVEEILSGYDVVVDGCDNFPTRYLVNDACVKLKVPCVHGSVFRFDGQVSVFDPQRGGPCYRCAFPHPPPPDLAPSCAEAGVLGVLPGVIGLLEAVETVKLILGIGDPLVGRLLDYDALAATFREYKIRKNPDCDYCGEGKEFPGYVEYNWSCSVP